MSLPLADPQFWIVTAAAAVALALTLRRLLRRPKASSANSLPCARCAQAGEIGHPPTPRRRGGRAVLLALAVAGAQPVSAAIVERDVAAMGSALRLSIEAVDRPTGLAVSNAIVAAVEDAERRLSTWLKASELVSYNAAPSGAKVAFSPLAWHAVETAIACWRETGGAFDPTVAPLVEAWGLRSGGRLPVASEIETARRLVDAGRLELDREHRRVGQPGGARIEEGGFGKGAGLDAALAAARAVAPGAHIELDFGGQLAWTGRRAPVEVAVADPRDRSRAVLALTLDAAAGSLSTSGNSEHPTVVDGVRIGHLLDPRTGRPAREIGSATVLATEATAADCRSTGLYVLGEAEGVALMSRWSRERRAEAVLLLIEAQGLRALVSPGFAGRVRALVPELRIQTIGGFS